MANFDDDLAKKAIRNYINNYGKNDVVIMDGIETEEQIINEQHRRFMNLIKKYSHIIHVKINDYYLLNSELPYDIKISVDNCEFKSYCNYDKTVNRWFYINILKKQLYHNQDFIFSKMIKEIHKMNAHMHDYKATFDGKTIHLIRK